MANSDSGDDMKVWYHPKCMFETLQRARSTTKKIETPDDLEDFSVLNESDKEEVRQLMKGMAHLHVHVCICTCTFIEFAPKSSATPSKKQATKSPAKKKNTGQTTLPFTSPSKPSADKEATPPVYDPSTVNHDNSFRQFRRLCDDLEKEPSYNSKTKLISNYLKHGTSGGIAVHVAIIDNACNYL